MPLIFSDSKEPQNHGVAKFKELEDKIEPDMFVNSYSADRQISPLQAQYKTTNNANSKSEDSSLDLDSDLDKNLKHVYISEDLEEDSIVETTALRHKSEPSNLTLDDSVMADNYLTVSGTIKRGKKKGQSVEVILNMSREELEILEANMTSKKGCFCNTKNGVGFHVLLWTILCFPFSVFISGIHSFCVGTITWYNIFKFFSENKTLGLRIVLPPLLIILYPFLIISLSIGLGLFAGIKQLSCCWDNWQKEFTDYEKGFYGWLCNSLDIPECSPYEVVILSSIQKP